MVGSFSLRSSRTRPFPRILKSCKLNFPVVENAVEWIRIVNHSSPFEWKYKYLLGFSRCGKQLAAILIYCVYPLLVASTKPLQVENLFLFCFNFVYFFFFFFFGSFLFLSILNVLDLTYNKLLISAPLIPFVMFTGYYIRDHVYNRMLIKQRTQVAIRFDASRVASSE